MTYEILWTTINKIQAVNPTAFEEVAAQLDRLRNERDPYLEISYLADNTKLLFKSSGETIVIPAGHAVSFLRILFEYSHITKMSKQHPYVKIYRSLVKLKVGIHTISPEWVLELALRLELVQCLNFLETLQNYRVDAEMWSKVPVGFVARNVRNKDLLYYSIERVAKVFSQDFPWAVPTSISLYEVDELYKRYCRKIVVKRLTGIEDTRHCEAWSALSDADFACLVMSKKWLKKVPKHALLYGLDLHNLLESNLSRAVTAGIVSWQEISKSSNFSKILPSFKKHYHEYLHQQQQPVATPNFG